MNRHFGWVNYLFYVKKSSVVTKVSFCETCDAGVSPSHKNRMKKLNHGVYSHFLVTILAFHLMVIPLFVSKILLAKKQLRALSIKTYYVSNNRPLPL